MSQPGNSENLRFSVVIPCYNSAAELRLCLAALAKVNAPRTEYIVVDDKSEEDLDPVISGSGLAVRLVRLNKRSGPAAARNHGARLANGEILVFLDADVCVHADTLALIEQSFSDPEPPSAVIGSYDDSPSDPGFHSQFRNLLHHYVHQTSGPRAYTFWTGCGAVRRDIFELHGGLREELGGMDDVEFGLRLSRAGERIDSRPDIQVQHCKRWTLFSWARTDLVLRGIPWTLLFLRGAPIPNTLNLEYRNRASVALICAAILAGGMGILAPWSAWAVLPLLAMVLCLNWRLYSFFGARRGGAFAAGAVAAHWFHLFLCGSSLFCGAVVYFLSAGEQWPGSEQAHERANPVKSLAE